MEEWVRDIIAPWHAQFLETYPQYDDDQLMIVYIDIYPVHIGEEFCTHVFEKYPYIILIFRVSKHILKQNSLDYLVGIFQMQSANGVAPKDIEFPSSLPVLRNTTAWRKCEILGTQCNLSVECLTGKESEKALRQFLCEDTQLATEIANRCGATHLAEVLTAPATDATADINDDESVADFHSHDDSDVSLNTVLQDSLGITVDAHVPGNSASLAVAHACRAEGTQGLIADDNGEDVWAYTDEGLRWDEVDASGDD
ncbi:hypothetical protein DFH06DRAFT_1326664 [Mycena polygramma]|nr:hypothetical protein DFH06DRAFT_1326664 [Mycena polygramma]